MAYYKSGVGIVDAPPIKDDIYPGWYNLDCGCCNGIRWGGDEPIDCDLCNASGRYFVHRKTGTVAYYPGGPLRGKMRELEMKRQIDERL